jgi:non-ribosomal peptide synthase protein (TIGR01720 family)
MDHPDAGPATEADRGCVEVRLDPDRTRVLLRRLPVLWRAQADDILLTALGRAATAWTGAAALHVEVEGHGRAQDLVAGLDLHRAVGWFTTTAPVLLRLPDADPATQVRATMAQLHGRPAGGLSHGMLAHLHPPAAELARLPRPALAYNYVGAAGSLAGAAPAADRGGLGLAAAPEPPPPPVHPDNAVTVPLAVEGSVVGTAGREQLHLAVRHSRRHYTTATAERFAAAVLAQLRVVVDAGRDAPVPAPTPADFPLLDADQATVDALLARAARASGRPGRPR